MIFQDSVFFGVLISLASYSIGLALKLKTGWSLMNPLLISIVLVIGVLLITDVSYSSYSAGANCISYLLTPATICLAVPLYQQVELLKRNYRAVLIGIFSGVLGNIFAEVFLKLLRIEEPIAKGIAIGCSSHALGTAKAMEMGTIEGAMSSLSIVVCGVMTVIGASIFALFI